jgi:hypothetical protein
MTEAELVIALKDTGLPVAYGSFKSKTNPPFITYQFSESNDLMADNQNYVDIPSFQIELYTTKKEPTTEKLLQDKLKELKLPYSKKEFWVEEEKLIQIIYEIQVIGG